VKADDEDNIENGDNGEVLQADTLEGVEKEADGVELVSVADEGRHGVYVTCMADIAPADLVEGLCNLLTQVTRAVLARPEAKRAGDLGLGEDVF
jgi:hypothetical protein